MGYRRLTAVLITDKYPENIIAHPRKEFYFDMASELNVDPDGGALPAFVTLLSVHVYHQP